MRSGRKSKAVLPKSTLFDLPKWITNKKGKGVGTMGSGANSLATFPRLKAGENGGFRSQG